MSPFLAEFIGTMLLVILGDGVCANVLLNKSKGQNSGWMVITTGWALGVAVAVYTVGAFSGAHINPAVTLGMAAIGKFPWTSVAPYVTAQVLGGVAGGVSVWLGYHQHWKEKSVAGIKMAGFCTCPVIRISPMNFPLYTIGII